jgi:hypothetical protein
LKHVKVNLNNGLKMDNGHARMQWPECMMAKQGKETTVFVRQSYILKYLTEMLSASNSHHFPVGGGMPSSSISCSLTAAVASDERSGRDRSNRIVSRRTRVSGAPSVSIANLLSEAIDTCKDSWIIAFEGWV